MNRFAALLDRLLLSPQRTVKLRLLGDYLRDTPDPDRGYALAALTGDLAIASVKPAMLRALITERLDPVLFGYSYDYVGDLAETIALAWPARSTEAPDPAASFAAPLPAPAGAGRQRAGPQARDAARTEGIATALPPFAGRLHAPTAIEDSTKAPKPAPPRPGGERASDLGEPLRALGPKGEGAGALADRRALEPPHPDRAASRLDPTSPRRGEVEEAGVGHNADAPTLAAIVETLQRASRLEGPRLMERWLDQLDSTGRWGLIKLVTGGLRVGVSARLAKQALADLGGRAVNEIEELWHGLEPPYAGVFAWLEGHGPTPVSAAIAPFRPVMLSHAIAEDELRAITPDAYAAEWKWDGIRVQAVVEGAVRRLYSRTGEDISAAFPDLVAALDFDGAIDGELLIAGRTLEGARTGSFGDLQQRLNRKAVSGAMMRRFPAFLRAYDCLADGAEDLRALPFRARRPRLEALLANAASDRIDLSPLLPFRDIAELREHRATPPEPVIEGLMLKRWDSAYEPGRPKGPWFKWKRDPHVVDAVLMYAQRGHGKRSSYYSDYTFGVWRAGEAGDELVPVGKAYFGFTDEELIAIDRFVRNNTIARFGPVREIVHEAGAGLVFEVAFEGLHRSTRHRSGVAMRFPRIARLRWDKPPAEADRLETLEALIRSSD